MRHLELLAPARDIRIGIAAIDCGADAVYIAGEQFGARQAAGNSVEDIRSLCDYAHRFGARIFITLNTILYEINSCRIDDIAVQENLNGDIVIRKISIPTVCTEYDAHLFILINLARCG